MPKVHYSAGTVEENEPSRVRKETWTGDLSISQRSGASPNYQRNQMYTFSPNDHHNPQNSRMPPSLKQTSPHLLVQSNTRSQAMYQQRRQEPRFSMTNKTRSDMIYKLREMGDEIDVLMRGSTASCRDLTSSLLHLKDLIEDVFVQVSVELQDLKAENQDLKNEGGRADLDEVERLENHFQNKIITLEDDRNHLQVSLNKIKVALQKGQSANEELSRKSRRSEQISRQASILQQQQDRNRAAISKLNAKLQQLTRAKEDLRKQASHQDEFLKQIKEEASIAIGSNKDLSRKAIEAESECAELRREMDLLAKKNRQLEGELEYLDQERQKILRQSKMNLSELSDIKADNNSLVKEVQAITQRLRHQKGNEEGLRDDLQSHRRELETERRRTGQLKGLHDKYKSDFEQSINSQRNNLGRRIQEYSDKYSGVDKNLMDQLKKGDYLQSEIGRYQKQLQDQRRKSNLLENDHKGRSQQHNNEKQNILRQLQDQAKNVNRQNLEIKSYNQKLTKCEDLLEDFARESDVNQKGLKGLRKQMEDERRKSTLIEEQVLRKLKALADQNKSLQQKAQQSKQKHSKSLEAMRDYQQRYRQAQMRLEQETRKTDMNNNKIKVLLAEMDEERRLSQIDVRDKKDLIRKIQEKNQQMSNQINAQKDQFKSKQASFFDRNKELQHYLAENGRQSDMLGKELLQLRDQYQNERRRSLAFEQEQHEISARMKQLGDKYGFVAQKLQQSQGMFKNKETMFNALEKKYKEIERVFLDQTRKSQLDQDQLKIMRDDMDRERRKSMAFEQESIDKMKGLLSHHNQLNQGLKAQQLRQQQQLELMNRVDQRTRLLEGQNRDLARMSDMHQNKINSYKEQLENERRRSMALGSQNKERLRAIQSQNLELLERLDQDRDRIGRNEQTLKQAEVKYGKIQSILQDERRSSVMSKAQFGKLSKLYEDERRKSSAIQQQSGRMIGDLVRRNQAIEGDTDRLERELSENNKTIRTLETKSSNAQRSLQQLSRMLDRATDQKEQADQVVDRCRQETRQKEEALRREKQIREQAFRDLRALEERMNQGQAQLRRVQQSRISLGREIQERQRQIGEELNNNQHMVETLKELKSNETSLKIRIGELSKINVENKATFQKNYQILKNEIAYRQQYNSEKAKRIQVLSQQAERDNKRVLAINPTQLVGSRTR